MSEVARLKVELAQQRKRSHVSKVNAAAPNLRLAKDLSKAKEDLKRAHARVRAPSPARGSPGTRCTWR